MSLYCFVSVCGVLNVVFACHGTANLEATYLHQPLASRPLWRIVGVLQERKVSAWTLELKYIDVFGLFLFLSSLFNVACTCACGISSLSFANLSHCQRRNVLQRQGISKAMKEDLKIEDGLTIVSTHRTGEIFFVLVARIVLFVLAAEAVTH